MKSGIEYAASFEADTRITGKLRDIIARHYYEHADPAWLASDIGIQSLNYEAVLRYTNACRWVVPWVQKHCDLTGAEIIDIGAGTGATMAAFAHVAKRVIGYEIEPKSVNASAERFAAMDTPNCAIKLVSPSEQLDIIKRDNPDGASFVMLFAVLEHLTQEERYFYLSTIWNEILRPGGYFIVVDTPNRFALLDSHTSEMPFFHLLPPYLALKYFERSPRAAFVDGMRQIVASGEDAVTGLHRWGLGASFHDFEVAFGVPSLEGLIVANGFEWEMTNWFAPSFEDQALVKYFFDREIPQDIGFARTVLNLIFRKPDGKDGKAYPRVPKEHLAVLVSYHDLDSRLIERGV